MSSRENEYRKKMEELLKREKKVLVRIGKM